MTEVVIYSRPGCHLCEEMKAVVERVAQSTQKAISVSEIDISLHAELERQHGLEIPVLMIDGRRVAKYRVTEDQLVRILSARPDSTGRADKAG